MLFLFAEEPADVGDSQAEFMFSLLYLSPPILRVV